MKPAFLLALSIDVECDKDVRWHVRRPLRFRGVEEGVGTVLDPLFAEYGARPTYLLSPEVLRDQASVDLFAGLTDCELGTHLHPEFVTGEGVVMDTSAVPCRQPQEKEKSDLEALTNLFRGAFSRDPHSYRAGRFGAGARTIAILGGLGYQVDTSVTPGKAWEYGLDFRTAPRHPYFPRADDIARDGGRGGVLEIPVTLRPSPAPAPLRRVAGVLARSRLEPTRRLAKWACGPAWFRPGWSSRGALLHFVRDAARTGEGTVLNMMFHNVDVIHSLSMNAPSEEAVKRTMDGVRAVLEGSLAAGGGFATLSEARRSVLGESSDT